MIDDFDRKALDRGITGNYGADNDPESRPPRRRPLARNDAVVATETFDEFVQVGDEMKAITVRRGDVGIIVNAQDINGTILVDFDGFPVDVWSHQVRAKS